MLPFNLWHGAVQARVWRCGERGTRQRRLRVPGTPRSPRCTRAAPARPPAWISQRRSARRVTGVCSLVPRAAVPVAPSQHRRQRQFQRRGSCPRDSSCGRETGISPRTVTDISIRPRSCRGLCREKPPHLSVHILAASTPGNDFQTD